MSQTITAIPLHLVVCERAPSGDDGENNRLLSSKSGGNHFPLFNRGIIGVYARQLGYLCFKTCSYPTIASTSGPNVQFHSMELYDGD